MRGVGRGGLLRSVLGGCGLAAIGFLGCRAFGSGVFRFGG